MAGRDAGERLFDDDDNQRNPNKIPEQPEKAEGFAQDAVPNRKAPRDPPLNTAPHPSPKRGWRKRETAPASRSLGLPLGLSLGAAPIHSLPDVLNAANRTFDMSYSGIREKEASELYWQDVYNHLRNREHKLLPDPLYVRRQPHIASCMHSDLVDWLVALADEYSLYEKLFLAVSYIDRFLSLMSVQRNCLQLLGTAALFTASRFREGDKPRCSDLLCASGNIYTEDDMLGMERETLKVLIYGVCAPTVYYLLRLFMEVSKAPAGLRLLAQYFCELALLDDDPYLRFPPSVIAGSAMCLDNPTFDRQP